MQQWWITGPLQDLMSTDCLQILYFIFPPVMFVGFNWTNSLDKIREQSWRLYNRTFPCMEAKYSYAIKNQRGVSKKTLDQWEPSIVGSRPIRAENIESWPTILPVPRWVPRRRSRRTWGRWPSPGPWRPSSRGSRRRWRGEPGQWSSRHRGRQWGPACGLSWWEGPGHEPPGPS